MILQSLDQLYSRIREEPAYEVAPPGFSLQRISFCVVIHPDGRLHAIEDRRVDGHSRQMKVLGTGKPAGSGINPCFLWDNTGYMLGYKPNDPKPQRTLETFKAFRERHLDLENEIKAPGFSAVCRFLEQWTPERVTEYPLLNEVTTGFGVFQIVGETAYVHQDPKIQDWWLRQFVGRSGNAPFGQCLLTGETAPIARLIPMIKGVSGGKAQMALVGFNDAAYESYGKSQAFNAPISEDAAFRCTSALNALLDGPMKKKHRFSLGDSTVVFWTDKLTMVEDIFAPFALYGDIPERREDVQDPEKLKKLNVFLMALRNGIEKSSELSEETSAKFYMLLLSSNSARIVVRRFFCETVGDLLENLRWHYQDMRIERQYAQNTNRPDPEFPPAWLLERQTARDAKDIPPLLHAPLLQSIMNGTRYPDGLMLAVMRRIHADRRINYPRACIIKGFLTRNLKKEVSMSLDKARKDPAYRAGRLFAALEKTQADALGNVNASIKDRYYGAASATPQSVFPRLLRMYNHHLGKLDGGRKVNRERLVQEIVDDLSDFPPHFNLADQGLFAIGYYHQKNDFYRPHINETPTLDPEL